MSSLKQIISRTSDYDPDALPVARANEVIGSFVKTVSGAGKIPLRAALGRVLAKDVVSPINVPSHDNSAMDGYAVRNDDLGAGERVTLTEIGTAYAGREFTGEVRRGECVRVMTGAVMPKNTDTVIIQEAVNVDGKRVTIPAGPERGQNRRLAGEDLQKGKAALTAGRMLRPADIGLIASLGIGEVSVRRKLKVAFFSTGDELVSVGKKLRAGNVYDSNRYTLWGMLTRLGCESTDLGVVRDDPKELEAAFRKAAAVADAVVTSGGVSVGEADLTRQMMAKLGEVVFWKIAMRPGRPMAFGRIRARGRSAYLFGLPGNPVAGVATFYQFVRGALATIPGRTDTDPPVLHAQAGTARRKKPGRTEYQRGILELKNGEWGVRLTGAQGSGILRSMSEANCFVVLGHDQGAINAGDYVEVMVLDGLV